MAKLQTQQLILLCLCGGLLIARVVVQLLGKRLSEKDRLNLTQRIQSWAIMVALLFIGLLNPLLTTLLFGLISFLGLKEYFSMISFRPKDRLLLVLLYLSIPVQYYFVYTGWYIMFLVFVPVYIFILLAVVITLEQEVEGVLKTSGILYWGVMINLYSVSHLAYLLHMSPPQLSIPSTHLILYLIMLTELNDICQYLFGRTLGHRRIIPVVSPNKTIAGFAGGACSTLLLSALLGQALLPGVPLPLLFLFGGVIGVFGFCGDIFLSAIKRDLHIKDTSQLIPGHGGILDRIDSLILVSPLFFHIFAFVYF
ncbi:MAG: phosphatidate cytidylyltransferase [Anaerotruncus sp.]|nr:phosphatidate cytidylyltransferase [Anaerotruncus sp.]